MTKLLSVCQLWTWWGAFHLFFCNTDKSVHWGEAVDKLQRNSSCHWSLGCTRVSPFLISFSTCNFHVKATETHWVQFVSLWSCTAISETWNVHHDNLPWEIYLIMWDLPFDLLCSAFLSFLFHVSERWMMQNDDTHLRRKNWLIKHEVFVIKKLCKWKRKN